ncbi:SPOR domain-containing protein [Bacillus licheniformis]|uniref:SPOR domain-containing protein n=1 Tax=Bacillus licheniformis TaxID=1402 RepID=UPI0011A6E48D|nr:SPOR domain-containing protein [Bacillus licheniformis]MDQ9098339.1 SPOR domain-containing protein [Bacillus licheniformis]MEC0478867.1 SPOR domain-containing protein [Bacillus licheniformis]MEC0492353.1 SPOR domain-containing protein [Bacillus licheniformis]
MKKRKSKKNSAKKAPEQDPLKVMINGREETIYGNEKEFSNRNEEKKFTFSNWEEKRKAEREISASKEDGTHETGEFTWTPPDEEETVYKDDPKVVAPYQKKNEPKNNHKTKTSLTYPVKRFAATIVFAVLLGTGLGLFALNLATHKEGVPASGSLGADAENGQTVKAGDSGAEEKKSGEKNSGQAGESFNSFAVQAGKFSSKEGADTLASQIADKGYAAVSIAKDDGFYVIAGITGEKQMTSELGKILIENDFEAWGGKELPVAIESGLLEPFKEAAELSAKAILGAEVTSQNIADVKAQLDGAQSKGSEEVKKSILEAVNLLEKPTAANGWKSQQLLLGQIK